jgi:hypothetical protein
MISDFKPTLARADDPDLTRSSGVSWSAVIGGAFVAAAFYLVLVALGAGMELSSFSHWSAGALSRASLTNGAIAWLVCAEIIASALGGYLTGRLRVRWPVIHTDEVFFRDTANGFLSWAVALVVSTGLLASAATSIMGGAVQLRADEETTGRTTDAVNPQAYFVDMLFRPDAATATDKDVPTAEGSRIFSHALRQGQLPADDKDYLTRIVAGRTGMSPADAGKRISDVFAAASQSEEATQKSRARLVLWIFFALIMGAFSASCAALIGGRQRDHVKAASVAD